LSQTGLTIRALHAGDDLEAELDLRRRAFGPVTGDIRDILLADLRASIAESRMYGVWEGPQMVGSARYFDFRQWWHGRSLPMAGVGGVKVAPEARGRGVGKALMTALLGVMAERGYLVSVLYPATAHIYRSLGWELAGGRYLAEIPGRSLGSLRSADPLINGPAGGAGAGGAADPAVPPVPLRRAGPDDAEAVIAALGAVHAAARDCGPCTVEPASTRRWLAEPDLFAYLADDGFLAYGWHGSSDRKIMVQVLQAASERTARALWGIVASHASVTEVVLAWSGPADPIAWLTSEPDVSVRREDTWMLRVLDAPAAIAGRGFPAAVNVRVRLSLADPHLPANGGPHTLTVSAGHGSLLRGETDPTPQSPSAPPVTLGPRGFAALFAGIPMATLRRAGLAAGGDASADAALDCAFAAQPYLLDYF
jgi:predicted N-acetyltransferase YhbS